MSREEEAMARSGAPLTRGALAGALRQAGLRAGDVALAHAAMSRLGWLPGAAQSVLEALRDVLGPGGTLAMNGDSTQLTDPGAWVAPPLPPGWVDEVRDAMPHFDPGLTPTRGLSRVNEALRAVHGVERSHHPAQSLLALGPAAADLTRGHPLAPAQGEGSPLARLYDADARIVLLGAGWESCTAFHLAEWRVPGVAPRRVRLPVRREGGRTIWQEVEEVEGFADRFAGIGAAFVRTGRVGEGLGGRVRVMPMRALVDFAAAHVAAGPGKTGA
ncbi:aminoglycoside N(3)-acetyltransferase [Wenxinia saemankumensis]|uniref:Aminoglycoside N(3)-acetyltransferase n=1 Tax=Wenxinia saemankumensis TaxID=1447782 RepID=A0A1M6C667_9RHOB|nr:AAC(3) family N-acetyltransferase [Wenxinia saemankumensis]SHI56525.1 aminoglycoside 3-N-acetyltransferase [Wenxinia saemankumensis]